MKMVSRTSLQFFLNAAFEVVAVIFIGIASVQSRLANLVGGRLEIDSTVGAGTAVTIVIPKHTRFRLDENFSC